jgi:hypothetical protein
MKLLILVINQDVRIKAELAIENTRK